MTCTNIRRLLDIMARLRDPEAGCPWDVKQTFASIAPYTIEEAYEVAGAIELGDMDALRDELGDLLLQVAFHARMAEEVDAFDFDDVAAGIADKMVRRHPHVFHDSGNGSEEALRANWEEQKEAERAAKAAAAGRRSSALDGVAVALPALLRAEKLTKRAARVGFDWAEAEAVFEKMEEEIAELRQEIAAGSPREQIEDEVGDLLFCVANLARHLKIDPEAALRRTNAKFERRFRYIEDSLIAEGRNIVDAPLDEMEARWQEAKALERRTGAKQDHRT